MRSISIRESPHLEGHQLRLIYISSTWLFNFPYLSSPKSPFFLSPLLSAFSVDESKDRELALIFAFPILGRFTDQQIVLLTLFSLAHSVLDPCLSSPLKSKKGFNDGLIMPFRVRVFGLVRCEFSLYNEFGGAKEPSEMLECTHEKSHLNEPWMLNHLRWTVPTRSYPSFKAEPTEDKPTREWASSRYLSQGRVKE